MVRYGLASSILGILLLHNSDRVTVTSFTPQRPPSTWAIPDIPSNTVLLQRHRATEKRSASVAASYYDSDDDESYATAAGNSFAGRGTSYLDTLGTDVPSSSSSGAGTKKRQRKVVLERSSTGGGKSSLYDVVLPIGKATSTPSSASQTLGLQLREIDGRGVVSDLSLDMDTLGYRSVAQEVYRDMNMSSGDGMGSQGKDGDMQQLDIPLNLVVDPTRKGIIVSGVRKGSIGWNAGVRTGDLLMATSATLGDKIWPKSTLDGVRSAISSRKLISSTMKFQFKREGFTVESAEEIVQEFEMELMRPLGVNIADKEDGFVTVTGFTEQASTIVREQLQIGDRVIAVESSMGGNMWPVSNVNGAISACTSRLPGQPVKIRFERVVRQVAGNPSDTTTITTTTTTTTTDAQSSTTQSITQTDPKLLSRCRDVLKRYIAVYDPKSSRSAAVPSLVADRVLETLADQSASLDPKTLSLVMNSYLLCDMPDRAIRAFEAGVGIAADGSDRTIDVVVKGKKEGSRIAKDSGGIDLYTGTDLIRAHARRGDYLSARRVLAAMAGGGGVVIGGIASAAWPGSIDVDTRCYNGVLAAAASAAGNEEGLRVAVEVFESMSEPLLFTTATPKKDLVSYNTMIEAFARAGKRSDAFAVYNSMRDAGVKPDKISITSLIKAVVQDDDIVTARIFLRDMKDLNIKADVVAYNTVIRALCDNLRWYDARELVAEMEECGISPDEKTYGLLMNGLLKAKKPAACLNLFEAACADQRTAALTENVQLYTTAVTAAAALEDYERALELVSRMTFAGVKPNMKTLTALMGACLAGGRPDFAIDVFKKIKSPDGFALTQAVKGYCEKQDFGPAIEIIESQGDRELCIMTGKQVMSNYDYIIRCVLEARDYEIAQKVMTNLLDNGFIPSKNMFRTIVTSLDLNQKKKSDMETTETGRINDESSKFVYLLSIFDSLARRNLQCDANFYSAVLFEGVREGGLARKIAAMMSETRVDTTQFGNEICLEEDEDEICTVKHEITWTELFRNYSQYKEELDEISLPPIKPRIAAREIRQVLLAEQGLTFGARRNRISPKN